jgi:hypothetical protein
VLGAGYGASAGRSYGEPADGDALSRMTRSTAEKVKGWCRVVYVDATIALVIGVVVLVFGWLTVTEAIPQVLAAFGGTH